jgi:hypothetical protein
MNILKSSSTLLGLLLSITISAFCQRRHVHQFRYVDGFSITAQLEVNNLVGELGAFSQPATGIAITLDKGITEKIHVKSSFQMGYLNGLTYVPYYSTSETNYYQWSISPVVNLTRLFANDNERRLNIFTSLGIAFIRFHADVYDVYSKQFLRTTSDKTSRHTPIFQPYGQGIGDRGIYYTREMAIPFEILLDWKLAPRIYLSGGLIYNWVSSDKLDGTTPYNLSDRTRIEGVNSYSDTFNDGWYGIKLGIKYKFIAQRFINQRGI